MARCAEPYCRNKARKGRSICHKCKSRRYKRDNPFGYYYNSLRNNARARGIEFNLTREEFEAFWRRHPEEWEAKKRDDVSRWEIDRKDNRKGYEAGNLQLLTKRKNVIKYHEHDKFMMQDDWFETHKPEPENSEAPF